MSPENLEPESEREVVSTCILNAPREKVFEAWTNPEILKKWWGPNGFTNTFEEFSLKPGGIWKFVMHGPDGKNYPNLSEFIEISAPHRIMFNHVSEPKFKVTAEFEDLDGKTKLVWRGLFETKAKYNAIKNFMTEGNQQNLARLAAELEKFN